MTNKKLKSIIIVLALAVVVLAPIPFIVTYYLTNFEINIIGDRDMKIGLNGIYDEQGATASIKGIDMSDRVSISGKVDTTKPGKYKITYSVPALTVKRTVTVDSEMNPVLKLADKSPITMKLGEKPKVPSYKAIDKNGNDITSKVQIDTTDVNKTGKGKIAYTVKDKSGNGTRIFQDVTVEANTNYDTPGLPICMFHFVYNESDPPADLHQRYGNYIGADALTEEIEWLKSENYYFPTWDEVEAYVKGELLLPEKSVVLTFDDGSKSFLECGIPVLEKCKVPATSFVITKNDGEKKVKRYKSDYVSFQSHSDNMHRGGGSVGHGGIFTALPKEDAVADLKKSIEIVGNDDAFAYPYGDYNDACVEAVREAGFKCAVTTQPGKARPGDNPLLLPRQRMSLGQSLQEFQNKVRPN